MLEGSNIDLKVVEKEELPQLLEITNRPEFWGLYESPFQRSRAEAEKGFDEWKGSKRFFIQKKDGRRIGLMTVWEVVPGNAAQFGLEIGYALSPEERGKGYSTEAVKLLLDYSYLTTVVTRIQAHTDVRNIASQRVLEKNGFLKEGTNRQCYFANGELHDMFIFSILRKEWKEPRILKATG
jgi:[ribosomal protein S5]-alanine N-acetyltransferase